MDADFLLFITSYAKKRLSILYFVWYNNPVVVYRSVYLRPMRLSFQAKMMYLNALFSEKRDTCAIINDSRGGPE